RETADKPLTFYQVKVKSPYNTYTSLDLPPAPITAPGLGRFNLQEEMGWRKVDPKSFHRIAHLRNQIAHSLPHEHLRLNVTKSEQGIEEVEGQLTIMLESISGSGKLTKASVSDVIEEFQKHDRIISNYIRNPKGIES
ncbi:MAG: hypothetical protein AAF212_11170, partial [Verrucomicrobiota bacterium]